MPNPPFRNPFIAGGPVLPAQFCGRRREVLQILDAIHHPSRGSVSVVGERRIGKTSLLHYVAAPATRQDRDFGTLHTVFLYKDCSHFSPFSPERFWRGILKDLQTALAGQPQNAALSALLQRETPGLEDMEALLRELEGGGILLVLLLDEFEYVLAAESAVQSRDFLGGLRALINQRERVLSLVTATRQPLADLCRNFRFAGSPFYNNFANLTLRPFSRREAESLLSQALSSSAVQFSADEQALIFELGGTHPLLLQAAAGCVYYAKADGDPDEGSIRQSYLDQAQHHFEDLWHGSSTKEKELLTVLACGDSQATTRLAQCKAEQSLLEKRGLLARDAAGRLGLFSCAFQTWLAEHLYVPNSPCNNRDTPVALTKPLVFVSYSHNNEKEKDALMRHLKVLEKSAGLLQAWNDDAIGGGADWEAAITHAIAQATVAVLLVTAEFLTSDFIRNKEIPALLRRQQRGELCVIPVIAKPCAWKKVEWLVAMNVLPKNGAPIWRDNGIYADDHLAELAEHVASLI